jgi:hypothetical protein
VETCEPVTKAFRLTLVLASQARTIGANVQRLAPETDAMPARALSKLTQAESTLRDTAAALAGKTPLSSSGRAGGLEPTVGQLRAVAAADRLASVPSQVRDATLALRRLAPSSDDELLALTVERARSLRRGVRRLKLELKRLRRVQQTFAP